MVITREKHKPSLLSKENIMSCIRIGIVGFGNLGQYLYEELGKMSDFKIVFVWNRTADKMRGIVPEEVILQDLAHCASRCPDLIVEVAHPQVIGQYGGLFIQAADLLIGSPTALADESLLQALLRQSEKSCHGLYIASGALWGAADIQKMADRGTLQGLKVTMKKHPSHMKLCGHLVDVLATVKNDPVVLYEGPVKDLCPLAPNNVNTMACAALAAHNLGFSKVVGCLVADPSLACHVVEVEVRGPGPDGNNFAVKISRTNPAASGNVTGKQTFVSLLSSIKGEPKIEM